MAETDEEEEDNNTQDITHYCYLKRYLDGYIEPVAVKNHEKRNYSEGVFKVKCDKMLRITNEYDYQCTGQINELSNLGGPQNL